MAAGQTASQAKAAATGYAYQQLLRQSSMLSYQNAFWVLSVVAAVLVPWPFIMRRPPKRKKPPERGRWDTRALNRRLTRCRGPGDGSADR